MTITAAVHMRDDSVIETSASTVHPTHGYVSIRPLPDAYVLRSVIHAQAPELRRLAAAALALADELDPPAEPTPPHDGWLNDQILAGIGHMRDRHDDPFGEGADR